METRARYVLIGAFVLACLLAGFGFVYWVANSGGIGARAVYAIRFEQPVSGLLPGATVLFNGVRVGAVSSISLDPARPKQVAAIISVEPKTPIRTDTAVDITFQGLTGAPAIDLRGGAADAPKLAVKDGEAPLLLAGSDVGKSLTDSARDTLRRVDTMIDQNAQSLNTAITGVAAFADMLGKNSKRVEGLLGGLESLTGGGKKETPPTYDLAAASLTGLDRPMGAQIVVGDVSAILVFDTQKILTRTAAGTFVPLADAQWSDNLPRLVQAKLVQSFENAQQLAEVSRPIEQLTPRFRLEVGIRAFQLVPEPQLHAAIELTVRLVGDKGAVAAGKLFSASAPAKSGAPADAVDTFNRAFTQVADEVVRWTASAVAAQAADAPPKKDL
jgi:phospholipid/cholesterol/gamma-HCH transport system substrate-binding protein